MNLSLLTAAQKHRMFRDKISPVLLPEGFVYKYGKFIRIHPGCVVLMVGLSLGRMWSDIVVKAIPIVDYEFNFNLREPSSHYNDRASSYARKNGNAAVMEAMKHRTTFEGGWFDALCDVFMNELLHPFVEVKDAVSLIDYGERFASRIIPKIELFNWGACIQIGDFNKSRSYVENLFNIHSGWLTRSQKELHEFDREKYRKMGFIDHENYLRESIKRIQSNVNFYENILNLLKRNDRHALDVIMADLIAHNEAPLRKVLPQFFI